MVYKKVFVIIGCVVFGIISVGCSSSTSLNTQAVQQQNQEKVVESQEIIEEYFPEPIVEEKNTVDPKEVDWDTSTLYIEESDNLQKAVEVLHSMNDEDFESKNTIPINIGTATKKPWEYYGQFVSAMGYVAFVQAYPPNSNVSNALGYEGVTTEIVIATGDGSGYADYLFIGDASNIAVGSYVRMSGLPCGLVDAPNEFGGSFTYFVMVGTEQPEVIYQ